MSRGEAEYADSDLIERAVYAVEKCLEASNTLAAKLRDHPEKAQHEFAPILQEGPSGPKRMLEFDRSSEQNCREVFMRRFPTNLQVVGEESLRAFKRWGQERYCILVDMVDGSDLMEMGVNLWCSAIVLYDRKLSDIIGCVIGLPSGQIFVAQRGEQHAKVRIGRDTHPLQGCSQVKRVEDARICFYGQKAGRFFSVGNNAVLQDRLERAGDSRFRIYNFAGNPMLVKLVDRPKSDDEEILTGDVDAVMELSGQMAHDMLPGVYIAKKAGAYVYDTEGREITFSALSQLLENPTTRTAYVAGATLELTMDIIESFMK